MHPGCTVDCWSVGALRVLGEVCAVDDKPEAAGRAAAQSELQDNARIWFLGWLPGQPCKVEVMLLGELHRRAGRQVSPLELAMRLNEVQHEVSIA